MSNQEKLQCTFKVGVVAYGLGGSIGFTSKDYDNGGLPAGTVSIVEGNKVYPNANKLYHGVRTLNGEQHDYLYTFDYFSWDPGAGMNGEDRFVFGTARLIDDALDGWEALPGHEKGGHLMMSIRGFRGSMRIPLIFESSNPPVLDEWWAYVMDDRIDYETTQALGAFLASKVGEDLFVTLDYGRRGDYEQFVISADEPSGIQGKHTA